MQKIGLVAGQGQFPFLFARAARKNGVKVFAAALEGETRPELEQVVEEIFWVKFGQVNKIISFFKQRDLKDAVMAGGVTKTKMFKHFEPDERVKAMMGRLKTLNDDNVLRELAAEFEKEGIIIRPSTLYSPELQAPSGILTRRSPSPDEEADIEFGWQIAKDVGNLDIGQCVVVRNRVVLAVEAIEGTDETIRRGGRLARQGAVVVKVIKPNQDFRFDVPSVGPGTVAVMNEVMALVLAIEAKKTLIFDADEMIAAADRAGIAIVARESE
ncbi:MAG: UDP-2,3-diacylglucosamine diphosphatase LpxI [Deltaproteobacteria bacterium]|nr:UDP-2,3-diacylglucosamine diphosphatase LpxI [Deltaproteobacteria bacterium]MBW2052750.1 UDP-2,3-diacylglucosamine diphosphatase LpxI [Deltaproteobacteria bacterium]MBW2139805.1 UDP-2,3-diacylglucosamine diphosphatase LpxI [Deltaproteobacteria bacterium]MBW2322709.1 UDP-2,3-diacylglucosamine diphosphatase LpxI [Deltaproteobacteria bacterium]